MCPNESEVETPGMKEEMAEVVEKEDEAEEMGLDVRVEGGTKDAEAKLEVCKVNLGFIEDTE